MIELLEGLCWSVAAGLAIFATVVLLHHIHDIEERLKSLEEHLGLQGSDDEGGST